MTHTKIKKKMSTIVKVGAKKLTSGVLERPPLGMLRVNYESHN